MCLTAHLTHLTEIVVTLLPHSKHDGDQFILWWKALKEGGGKEHMHRAFPPSQPDKSPYMQFDIPKEHAVCAHVWALHGIGMRSSRESEVDAAHPVATTVDCTNVWALHGIGMRSSRECEVDAPHPVATTVDFRPPHIRETCVPCLHGNEATECTRAAELGKMHKASLAWRVNGHAPASTACTRWH